MSEERPDAGRQFARKRPCGECPFSRACEPGGTGGSDPTVFVGQAYGPFWLPCHTDPDYNTPMSLAEKTATVSQCAGAAIFRANVGADARMPDGVHRLPADTSLVFATPAELIAHHNRSTLEEAEEILRRTPSRELLRAEIDKLSAENIIESR